MTFSRKEDDIQTASKPNDGKGVEFTMETTHTHKKATLNDNKGYATQLSTKSNANDGRGYQSHIETT
ncbi:hypothetical protein L484_015276 [Morus notabilis]|uniref:Uncharacterized protein n=1 Tax=Morus notabilis TaxID=981085 RepID=W9RTF9_9ROSA|nr:hypothetical protein L484_015276 [Morus notabilis]